MIPVLISDNSFTGLMSGNSFPSMNEFEITFKNIVKYLHCKKCWTAQSIQMWNVIRFRWRKYLRIRMKTNEYADAIMTKHPQQLLYYRWTSLYNEHKNKIERMASVRGQFYFRKANAKSSKRLAITVRKRVTFNSTKFGFYCTCKYPNCTYSLY